jgi:Txe/YoeB family toxin of Txe-Axe toxin-antitoxin module
MRWKENDNMVVDENGRMIAVFTDDANDETRNLVLKAPRMLEAINEYVETVENGGYTGKKVYTKFKDLLDRIYEV